MGESPAGVGVRGRLQLPPGAPPSLPPSLTDLMGAFSPPRSLFPDGLSLCHVDKRTGLHTETAAGKWVCVWPGVMVPEGRISQVWVVEKI